MIFSKKGEEFEEKDVTYREMPCIAVVDKANLQRGDNRVMNVGWGLGVWDRMGGLG